MSTIVIADYLSVAAGSSNSKIVYTVPGAKKLVIKRVRLFFPVGTEGYLIVEFRVGNFKILPDYGQFSGDGNTITIETEKVLNPNEELVIFGVNSDTTNPHSVYYVVEGVIE